MRPFFPPAVGFPSERSSSGRLQPKTIADQRLPKIAEESSLISEKKRGNVSRVFFSCFPCCRK